MSSPSESGKKKPEIYCPECNSRLSDDLLELLFKGRDVFCEVCGFKYTGINQEGEVKPLHKSKTSGKPAKYDTSYLNKQEDQWLKWKVQWNSIKSWFSDTFAASKPSTPPSPSPTVNSYNTPQSPSSNKKSSQNSQNPSQNTFTSSPFISSPNSNPSINSTTYRYQDKSTPFFPTTNNYSQNNGDEMSASPESMFQYEYQQKKQKKSNLTQKYKSQSSDENEIIKIKKALKILNDLTPVFYLIIILSTVISILANIGPSLRFLNPLSLLYLEVVVMTWDLKIFIPQEKEDKIPHAGLHLIIIGGFSINAFGVGVFLLIRGILHLLIFIYEKNHSSYPHPAIAENPAQASIWIREIVVSFIPYLEQLTFGYFLAVLGQILSTLPLSKDFGFLSYTIVTGCIAIVLLGRKILPPLRSESFSQNAMESGILSIILGAIAVGSGTGVAMLIFGILLVIYHDFENKLTENLPFGKDISDLQFSIRPSNSESDLSEDDSENKTSFKRYDPNTGQLLSNVISSPSSGSVPIQDKDIYPPISPLIPKNNELIFDENLIYTVLEPEIRKKLLELPINNNERDDIARSFIYMSLEQQLRYLEEIISSNIPESEINANYIKRIESLPLPEGQHQFLIEQLNYLPEEKLEEFVTFLEESVVDKPTP